MVNAALTIVRSQAERRRPLEPPSAIDDHNVLCVYAATFLPKTARFSPNCHHPYGFGIRSPWSRTTERRVKVAPTFGNFTCFDELLKRALEKLGAPSLQ